MDEFDVSQDVKVGSNTDVTQVEHSGKLIVVNSLLSTMWKNSPRERIVLVSAFTSTLDMLEKVG